MRCNAQSRAQGGFKQARPVIPLEFKSIAVNHMGLGFRFDDDLLK
jgi:hypothetical protein